jgi:hypothetical protein
VQGLVASLERDALGGELDRQRVADRGQEQRADHEGIELGVIHQVAAYRRHAREGGHPRLASEY